MNDGMITHGTWNVFLTLQDEHLLLVKRQHPFVVVLPILFIIALALFFISSAYILFGNFLTSHSLFFVTSLLLISIAISLITKVITDWYFHVYILTNRKILELRYTPLNSYIINDVMLDRVMCTEVDLQTHGFFRELLDIGDIVLTFDRPTHEEDFVLKDLQGSHNLAIFLTQRLLDVNQTNVSYQPIWFKERSAQHASY